MSDIQYITFPHLSRQLTNLNGKRFDRWTVIGYAYKKGRRHFWLCRCDCGTLKYVEHGSLRDGQSGSCGCRRGDANIARSTHGESGRGKMSPEYRAYHKAKQRCENPSDAAYRHYGGRGIRFLFASVDKFIEQIGRRPTPKHTLDRIDNDGNYEPGNVRWATMKQQCRNRRSSHLLTAAGQTKTLAEWRESTGLRDHTLIARLKRGWCDECVVGIVPNKGVCSHKTTKPHSTS